MGVHVVEGDCGQRFDQPGVVPDGRRQLPRDLWVSVAQRFDLVGNIAPDVAARAEEERQHHDPSASVACKPMAGLRQPRGHELEERELNRYARTCGPDGLGDSLERRGPSGVAGAMRQQNQAVAARRGWESIKHGDVAAEIRPRTA